MHTLCFGALRSGDLPCDSWACPDMDSASSHSRHPLDVAVADDWLLYCHLVARVDIMSTDSLGKHFPGADEYDLSI